MRHLPNELRDYLDSQIPIPLIEPRLLLLAAANACIGVKEIGENQGKFVELFQSVVGKAEKEPWCIAFLQALIAYVELRIGAESPLPATEHSLTLWDKGKAYSAVHAPKAGELILWRMGKTLHGHGGIITGGDSLTWRTIEGNTGPAVGMDRDGDGVYAKTRAKGGSKTFVELGFLRVFNV